MTGHVYDTCSCGNRKQVHSRQCRECKKAGVFTKEKLAELAKMYPSILWNENEIAAFMLDCTCHNCEKLREDRRDA